MKSKLLGVVFALLCSGPAFATIIIGLPPDPGNGNCFPFGCSYSGEYQQVYSASQFSGPIEIGDLEFYNTKYNSSATSMNSGTWTISLSTTSANWNTLSSNFASNIGANHTVVFSGNLAQPWAFGDTLHIDLSTPFLYDPTSGNLLMDVSVSGAIAGGIIFFDTNGFNGGGDNGNTFLGRVFCLGGGPCGTSGFVDAGYGLVTGFSTAQSVPEPASLALFASSLGALGLLGWRRKRKAQA